MRRSKQTTTARVLGLLVALMVVPTASMAQVPHDMAYLKRYVLQDFVSF